MVSIFNEHDLKKLAEALRERRAVAARIARLGSPVAMCAHCCIVIKAGEKHSACCEVVESRGKRIYVGASVRLDISVYLLW